MGTQKVLRQAIKLATPPKEEQAVIELATSVVLKKLNRALERKRIKAKTICGGSFAKGTWLPSHTDIDCFVVFDYRNYKEQSKELADILEPAIELAFTHYVRLHGSRDYFQANYDDYLFEFVPVLKIKKISKALNITDVSPLHVDWVAKNAKKTKLKTEIRLAKLFFKAAGVYGAESYIRGFSGHVAEILIAHYGSFRKLARASQSWKPKVYIDPEHHWGSVKKAMQRLNKSKLTSPLVIVDPIQPERNAAAALNLEKFERAIEAFKEFITAPHIDLFKVKTITIKELKANARGRKLLVLKATPQHDKKDVAGAKLLKQFERILKQLKLNDFKLREAGWQWNGEDALFWIYTDKEALSETKKHYGPPMSARKDRVDGFIKKYGKKARREKGKLYVVLKRAYKSPEPFLRSLLKDEDFQNVKLLK